ncbi:MAG: hypothetical protein EAX81_07355 [Candidatus Thorarchaeota archaeon]|nr:hypothetical protein [Candidatus Thorarchaeota archaeon]
MRRPRTHSNWSRRTSFAPKGYLRYRVLNKLNEKPMSGAEIIREVEENTGGRWKPSPGSVYPLLSWLLDSGYTREIADTEAGIRRYELTDQGKKFLEEHEQRRTQDQGSRFFGPRSEDWEGPMPEEAHELLESWHRMRHAGHKLHQKIRENYSEALVKEAKKLVDDFVIAITRLTEDEKK